MLWPTRVGGTARRLAGQRASMVALVHRWRLTMDKTALMAMLSRRARIDESAEHRWKRSFNDLAVAAGDPCLNIEGQTRYPVVCLPGSVCERGRPAASATVSGGERGKRGVRVLLNPR